MKTCGSFYQIQPGASGNRGNYSRSDSASQKYDGLSHSVHNLQRKKTVVSNFSGRMSVAEIQDDAIFEDPQQHNHKKQLAVASSMENIIPEYEMLDKYGKYSIQYRRKKAAEEAIQKKQMQYFLYSQSKDVKQKDNKRIPTQETRADTISTLHTHMSLDHSNASAPKITNLNQSQTNLQTNQSMGGQNYMNSSQQHIKLPPKKDFTIKPKTSQLPKRPVLSDEVLDRLEKQRKKQEEEEFKMIFTSSVDSELPNYRFRSKKTIEIERKESIQEFIYNKKFQNRLKYSDRSKINTTALPVPKGSISVMLNVAKKDYGFNLNNFKKKIPAKSKFKMKWKTIQWLLANKQDVIKQLFSNYSLMLKFAKNKVNTPAYEVLKSFVVQKEGMDRSEFGELLSNVGLGAEKNLGDKLFYIFDDDNSGTVDYKELIIGLEMFKENSIDEKLKVFMELCDADGNGKVSPNELYSILKQNLFNHDDKVKLKGIIRDIFRDFDLDQDGMLDKSELYKATSTNTLLLGLLEESVRNVKRVDQIIENDLEEPFHCWVPISANFVNYKEGIHFGLVNKLLKAVEHMEDGFTLRKESRQKLKDAYVLGKTQKELEMMKEDSLNESSDEEEG